MHPHCGMRDIFREMLSYSDEMMESRSTTEQKSLALLLEECQAVTGVSGERERTISSVEYDSRRVGANTLFVAIEGFESDGHRFIHDAISRGAVAVVVSSGRRAEFAGIAEQGITLIDAENSRRALSQLSAAFFRYPASRMAVLGITGTNGKTSVTYMLESILSAAGYTPGIIGTVNYRWGGKNLTARNTTPESRDLQELLSTMSSDGVDVAIMEVSSHGLDLNRVDDISFDVSVFTNLSRDHLDYHHTFDDYFTAKMKIFDLLERSVKPERCGVVNIDDVYGKRILDRRDSFSYPLVSYGISDDAHVSASVESIVNAIDGISYQLTEADHREAITLQLSGIFNVYNSLCAIAVARALHLPFEQIREGLAAVKRIPGRFDRIASRLGFHVIVDYAHTDDALLKLLESVQGLHPRRLIAVFGCGGNRDVTKRPIMGKIAVEHADWVVITNDNPRREDPRRIIDDIVAGVDRDNYEIIPDRAEAIERAIGMAEAGDIVVIAGKGHEDYQILGTERIHFDDRERALHSLREREGR